MAPAVTCTNNPTITNYSCRNYSAACWLNYCPEPPDRTQMLATVLIGRVGFTMKQHVQIDLWPTVSPPTNTLG